jgi:hypothetical protein
MDLTDKDEVLLTGWDVYPDSTPPQWVQGSGFWMAKLSSLGELMWQRVYQVSNWQQEKAEGYSIKSLSDKGIAVGGELLYYDTIDGAVFKYIDGFLLKTDSMGCMKPGCGHVSPLATASWEPPGEGRKNILLFPNPASNELEVQWDDFLPTGATMEVYSSFGLLQMKQPIRRGANRLSLSVDKLPAGMYVLILRRGAEVLARERFVKQ